MATASIPIWLLLAHRCRPDLTRNRERKSVGKMAAAILGGGFFPTVGVLSPSSSAVDRHGENRVRTWLVSRRARTAGLLFLLLGDRPANGSQHGRELLVGEILEGHFFEAVLLRQE